MTAGARLCHLSAMRTLLLLLAALVAVPGSAAADEPSYAETYWLDYAAIAISGGGFGLLRYVDPPTVPLLDATEFKPYTANETVSEAQVGGLLVAGYALSATLSALDGDTDGVDGWRWHDASLGYFEALGVTLALTEASKILIGRPRPDFDDRRRRGGDMLDGRRSFWSGHASMSFAGASFLAWQLAGHFVWGSRERSTFTRVAAGAVASGLLVGAGAIAASRISDGRHHVSDVLTGAAVGSLIGTGAFFRHFKLNNSRRASYGAPREAQVFMLGTSGVF